MVVLPASTWATMPMFRYLLMGVVLGTSVFRLMDNDTAEMQATGVQVGIAEVFLNLPGNRSK